MKNEKINKYIDIIRKDNELLRILLKDNSSKKNILWATDHYKRYGELYGASQYISIEAVLSKKPLLIKPRINKSKREQQLRSKSSAEVFTPSWICNSQNNLIDDAWFCKQNIFNFEGKSSWEVNNNQIEFPEDKSWIDYVKDTRLEISCGEAPYIVSRYDTVTGEYIELKERIGLLDRKIRVVNENTNNEEEWFEYILLAYKNVYGYDWQGDNVLIARENLLLSFIEYYDERFDKAPSIIYIHQIAEIITWNIWQMDGLKYVIPNSCKTDMRVDVNLFGEGVVTGKECFGCQKDDPYRHNGIYCKITDWEKGKKIKYIDLLYKGGTR
jgi:hypothetical protein